MRAETVILPANPFCGEREIKTANYPEGRCPHRWWTSPIPVRGWKVFFPASGMVFPRKRYPGKAVAEACESWNNSTERARYLRERPLALQRATDGDFYAHETWNDFTDDFRMTPEGKWVKDRTYRSDFLW